MLSLLIVSSIAISVAIGYKTKFNTGFFAIIFSYLIGCFAMNMSTKEVIGGWPISTMFVIFSVSLFYNFALVNGTLEKTARNMLYACRKRPGLLPFALYFASAIIAALGAGFFTVMAFMAPITILICKEAKMDQLTGAVAINCGALSGANFMISGSGVVFQGLMQDAGIGDEAFIYTGIIFAASVIFSLILITGFRYIPKSNRNIGKDMVFEKPEPFTKKQKQNLTLIISMIVIVLFFPVAHLIIPNASAITYVNGKIDVGLVAIIFSVIALFLDLGSQKDVIAKVPWNTIIMICGVGMLINVAIEAGTLDLLASWVGSNLPAWFVPIAFAFIGACMSFFSSTLGVVCPALFPLVPALSQSTGISPLILFACIVVGAQSSAISPFSSGGSLILGSCATDEERNEMFPKLLFIGVPISVLSSVVFCFIMSIVL